MKLLGYTNDVKIKNISGGRIALGKFALAHNQYKVINPIDYSEATVKTLDNFLIRNRIEVDFNVNKKEGDKPTTNTVKKETIKNDKGENHEHTVYDPETVKKSKLIEVQNLTDNSKAITINKITKEEAQEFLEQHWKKVEKEIAVIGDIGKLEYILSVAVELGMTGNKKYELVEDRIEELR